MKKSQISQGWEGKWRKKAKQRLTIAKRKPSVFVTEPVNWRTASVWNGDFFFSAVATNSGFAEPEPYIRMTWHDRRLLICLCIHEWIKKMKKLNVECCCWKSYKSYQNLLGKIGSWEMEMKFYVEIEGKVMRNEDAFPLKIITMRLRYHCEEDEEQMNKL